MKKILFIFTIMNTLKGYKNIYFRKMLFYTAYSVFMYVSKPYIKCDRFIDFLSNI